ncbi:unnamed protein product, partial [Prorocentrum cordatum]
RSGLLGDGARGPRGGLRGPPAGAHGLRVRLPIFRPGFPYRRAYPACVRGLRRFWQRSCDHRGTPEAPGRVVTLVEAGGANAAAAAGDGQGTGAKPSPPSTAWPSRWTRIDWPGVLAELDVRERHGYVRTVAELVCPDDRATPLGRAVLYFWEGEHSSAAYAGPEPLAATASVIASAEGPSGRNDAYLRALEAALREWRLPPDPYLLELLRAVDEQHRPPRPRARAAERSKGVPELRGGARDTRCTPVIYMDLNDGVGYNVGMKGELGHMSPEVVGAPTRERIKDGAGSRLRKLCDAHHLYLGSATVRVTDTFYGEKGSSRIGYMVLPQGMRPLVRSCQVLPSLGAKQQAIKGAPPKDHLPIQCCIGYRKYGMPNLAERTAEVTRWDQTAMMEAVRTGRGREQFVSDVRLAMPSLPLRSLIDWDPPDTIFEALEKCVHTLASEHFGEQQGLGEPWSSFAAERRRLLRERAQLRGSKLGLTEEAAGRIDEELNAISKAEATRARRAVAYCRSGPKRRDGRPFAPAPPSAAEWLDTWRKEGHLGGMKAQEIQWGEWRQQREGIRYEDADVEELKELVDDVIRELKRYLCLAPKRRVVPPGTLPCEIWLMLILPNWRPQETMSGSSGSGCALQLPDWHSPSAAKRQADGEEGKGTGGGAKKSGGVAKKTRTGHKGLQEACAKLLLITAREAMVRAGKLCDERSKEMKKEAESSAAPDYRGRGAPHLHVFMALIVHCAAKEKGALEKDVATAVEEIMERLNNAVRELSLQHISRIVKHCRVKTQKKKEQADQMATLYLDIDRHNTVGAKLFETLSVAIEAEGGGYVGGSQPRGLQRKLVCLLVDSPDVPLHGMETIWRDGRCVGYVRSTAFGHTVGRSIAYGYVDCPETEAKITNKWLEAGVWQVGDKGDFHAASLSLKAPFDPKNERVKGNYPLEVREASFVESATAAALPTDGPPRPAAYA